jgi:6-pyruvoyltetrahydropterin/6-carboxytetrahydropterin synthase
MKYTSTKIIELGSCAFRQWRADSHCKYIHGYRLVAKYWFGCNTLDEKNWVVDFGGLSDLKKVLEKQFDHTLCVAEDDPLIEGFKSLHAAGGCDLRIMTSVGIEKTAEWCLVTANNYIKNLTNNRCWVEKVEVWEHEKNSAIVEVTPGTAITVNIPGNTESTTIQAPVHAPELNKAKQVFDFMDEVREETGVNLSEVLKNPPLQAPRPAPVGNRTTTGFSNLFGGTSWGT